MTRTIARYTIEIERDTKSGWYCGQCKDLPEAISQGKSLEELITNMQDAISLVLKYKEENTFQSL